jgi:uncharacterized protein
MDNQTISYIFGAVSALLIGFSKTGLPGVSIPAILLMAEAFPNDAQLSVVAILPIILVGDVFAVSWYHHHAQWPRLWVLFPWVIAGMIPGAVAFQSLESDVFRPVLGILVLAMLAFELWRRWRLGTVPIFVSTKMGLSPLTHLDDIICHDCELQGLSPCKDCPRLSAAARQNIDVLNSPSAAPEVGWKMNLLRGHFWFVAFTGLLAGFATFLANAAMPVMSVYLISQGFDKREFIGTAAWFFFLLNLSKMPVYFLLGRMSMDVLPFDLCLMPVTLLGAFVGVYILARIPQKLFNALALILAGVAAVRLIVA